MAQSAVSESEKAVPPRTITRQESTSGTPRGPDGITTPDDYVRELADPVKRMELFEEMGQGDDAVHVGISARRQEICAANWKLATEDTTPRGTEILEFVEDNIYPFLDDLLRWLGGGAMQYGFGAIEPVFQWSDAATVSAITRGKVKRPTRRGERRIYLRKLAHIRQTAIQSFVIAGPDSPGELAGDLQEVRQHCFDGKTYRERRIPAEKLLLWTYDRQGDDHFGVPPARHCYKAWKFKTQMERLNLLHIDKFGVGTVVVEAGEGWTAAENSLMAAAVAAWRSGTANFILHPTGGSISIVSDEGKGTMSTLEWVRYYNLQTAKTYMTQGTELGSTETGARALGEVFVDQMQGLVQADVEALGSLINNRLIIPLVRYNFGEQAVYPMFTPSHRVKMSGGVATVLAQLVTAGAVHLRPEDEAWARDAFELPPVDLNTLTKEADERKVAAKTIADAAAKNVGDNHPPPKVEGGGLRVEGKPPLKVAATRAPMRQLAGIAQLADGAPPPAVSGKSTYRSPDYHAWEHGILRPDALMQELDLQTARTAGEVTDVLRQIDEALATQVEKLANKGTPDLSAGVQNIACPERLRTQLRKALMAAAQRARDFGSKAVVNEVERQLGPTAIGPQRAPSLWTDYYDRTSRINRHALRELVNDADQTPEDYKLAAAVDRAVEDEIDRRESSARSAALTALYHAAGAAAGVLASIAISATKDALVGLSSGRTQQNVGEVVNIGFSIGRSETAQEIRAGVPDAAGNRSGLRDAQGNPIDLVAKVYSAVMDFGTCDECAKWDGAEFPIDYPEDYTGVQAPNPRCAGGTGRCRCLFVYITSREQVPLVPASKGPEPIRRAS